MEIESTVFPGKQDKPQSVRSTRSTQVPKSNAKEQPFVHKRVFGTVRNSNMPEKSIPQRPEWNKPSLKLVHLPKEPPTPIKKPVRTKPSKKTVQPEQTTTPAPKYVATKKKKSVSFLDQSSVLPTGEGDPKTPGPAKANPRRGSGTPYHTAERCSSCRFDRMETASYWLTQITVAEAVGKHFVSRALFMLALQSKAEPIRNLRAELKRYVSRHKYISGEQEWIDVLTSYGFTPNDEAEVKAHVDNGGDLDEACEYSTEQNY